ncbi:MAG TPA: hypothetical protein VF041_21985 [Gemmatimonadaceae bacterium]
MSERERRDEDEEYREEAKHAREVAPEFSGERLIFDQIRDEPEGPDPDERAAMGELAAPVEGPETKPELVGEGVGGASGAIVGAALGSLAGPVGAIVGAFAGAIGGWWTGRTVVDVASGISADEDAAFRRHYAESPARVADRPYEHARPAYHLGRIARANPEYEGRSFEEIEPVLERGWTAELRDRHGEWHVVRTWVREGFVHGERHERLGGTPRTMTPSERALDRLHSDDTAI